LEEDQVQRDWDTESEDDSDSDGYQVAIK
jgi:hypothetical protein